MPTVSNANLSIDVTGNQSEWAELTVTYDVEFTTFEKWLWDEGRLDFHTHVTAHGWDGVNNPIGPSIQSVNDAFGRPNVRPTAANAPLAQTHGPVTVPRSDLQEDPGSNSDEIKCNIRIHSPLPSAFTEDEYTNESILLG